MKSLRPIRFGVLDVLNVLSVFVYIASESTSNPETIFITVVQVIFQF